MKQKRARWLLILRSLPVSGVSCPPKLKPGSLPAVLGEMRGWVMMSRRLPNLCLHFCRRIIFTSPWRWTHSSSQVRAWKARQQQLSATGGGASFGSRSREKRSFTFSDQQPNSPSPLHPNLRRYRQRPPSRCLGSVSSLSRSSRRQSVRQLTHRDSACCRRLTMTAVRPMAPFLAAGMPDLPSAWLSFY